MFAQAAVPSSPPVHFLRPMWADPSLPPPPLASNQPLRESERLRIERQNPNPKMPMVRYIGGTWRVGGLLALSRAFGDAYLKGSLQFEGIAAGGDGYGSGFGVIAEPYTTVNTLTGGWVGVWGTWGERGGWVGWVGLLKRGSVCCILMQLAACAQDPGNSARQRLPPTSPNFVLWRAISDARMPCSCSSFPPASPPVATLPAPVHRCGHLAGAGQ
jgi:hypothetical protein